MKFLVYGATGTVGSAVVRELLARKHEVRLLTRDPAKAKSLGAGVEVVQGDALSPGTVRSIFEGLDGVFLLNPVSQTEVSEGLMAVTGAMKAKVKRIVYLSVHNVDTWAFLPHFGSKAGVEEGLRRSGIPYTILRPNNFYQNDVWFRDALLQYGTYPQPLGNAGVSRVDVRDIAEAAAIALISGAHDGKTYNLVGPRPYTADETAKIWSGELGREIRYMGDDLAAWEKMFLAYMPDWMVYDFGLMYDCFQKYGFKGTAEDIAAQTTLLGHAPRGYEDYVKETAAEWAATAAKP